MSKKMVNKKVQKALAPEEVALVDNIGSLIDQLKSSGGGSIEEEVMMADDEEEDMVMKTDGEYEEEDEVMKESNGPTANPEDKAEDRVEDPTDITAGNLAEVGKSLNTLVRIMKSRQGVQKSAKQPMRQQSTTSQSDVMVIKSLAQISKVMKSLADRQNSQDLALQNILDGIGFTENVQKSIGAQKQSNVPVGNLDGAQVLSELTTVLKGLQSNGQNTGMGQNPQWGNVQKSSRNQLVEAMPSIFGVN